MTAEERIGQLEAENATLREQLAEALEQLSQALVRIHELEGQLAKDSHNSSKPPSSDGPRRKRRSQHQKSEKPTGGQPGHAGRSLMQVESPDEVMRHRPMICGQCQQPLEGIAGQIKERRQIHDLPLVGLVVREYQVEMADLLVSMAKAADEWRKLGAPAVPAEERDAWVAQYFDLLASGFAVQPPPSAEDVPKRGGRPKQSAAKNLLDDLLRRAEQVLAFLDDLSIPFTNNQAERDLRMVKVQQKIAGTFRSEDGATAFCRIRSYLSTMRKQGHPMLAALAAVFAGQPLPIAWAPG